MKVAAVGVEVRMEVRVEGGRGEAGGDGERRVREGTDERGKGQWKEGVIHFYDNPNPNNQSLGLKAISYAIKKVDESPQQNHIHVASNESCLSVKVIPGTVRAADSHPLFNRKGMKGGRDEGEERGKREREERRRGKGETKRERRDEEGEEMKRERRVKWKVRGARKGGDRREGKEIITWEWPGRLLGPCTPYHDTVEPLYCGHLGDLVKCPV